MHKTISKFKKLKTEPSLSISSPNPNLTVIQSGLLRSQLLAVTVHSQPQPVPRHHRKRSLSIFHVAINNKQSTKVNPLSLNSPKRFKKKSYLGSSFEERGDENNQSVTVNFNFFGVNSTNDKG